MQSHNKWLRDKQPDDDEVQQAADAVYGELKGVIENTTPPKERGPMDHPRSGPKGRPSPVIAWVRKLGNYKVTSEVAEELGMSETWVYKMVRERRTQAPSHIAPFGDNHIHLFTPEDIEALRDYIDRNQTVMTYDEFNQEEE